MIIYLLLPIGSGRIAYLLKSAQPEKAPRKSPKLYPVNLDLLKDDEEEVKQSVHDHDPYGSHEQEASLNVDIGIRSNMREQLNIAAQEESEVLMAGNRPDPYFQRDDRS